VPTLPTPRDYEGIHTVHAACAGCDRIVKLDLVALVEPGRSARRPCPVLPPERRPKMPDTAAEAAKTRLIGETGAGLC
jgi:hypothetical protein